MGTISPFWYNFVSILVSFWFHVGSILVPFWFHWSDLGAISGPFRFQAGRIHKKTSPINGNHKGGRAPKAPAPLCGGGRRPPPFMGLVFLCILAAWNLNGTEIAPKLDQWNQNGTEMEPTWDQNIKAMST